MLPHPCSFPNSTDMSTTGAQLFFFFIELDQLFFSLIFRALLFFSTNSRAQLFFSILHSPPPPGNLMVKTQTCGQPSEPRCPRLCHYTPAMPPVPGFNPTGHVRKLPVTLANAMYFKTYSGSLHHLQLSTHDYLLYGRKVTTNDITKQGIHDYFQRLATHVKVLRYSIPVTPIGYWTN